MSGDLTGDSSKSATHPRTQFPTNPSQLALCCRYPQVNGTRRLWRGPAYGGTAGLWWGQANSPLLGGCGGDGRPRRGPPRTSFVG